MIKKIEYNNRLFAKIIRANYEITQNEFFTDERDEIQFGTIFYEKSHKTNAHYHNHLNRENLNQIDEILIIQKGSCRVDFYNNEGMYLKSVILNQNDTIIIYRGGHNIVFLDDTRVLTIKPGAYDKENDKTRIIGANNLELVIEND